MILYGIPGCDTVRKARRWLGEHEIEHTFHDYKKLGIDVARLRAWASRVGWESLLNRRGTTWRALDDDDRLALDEARAVALMAEHTSLIKRPVVEHGDEVLVGFDERTWQRLLVGGDAPG